MNSTIKKPAIVIGIILVVILITFAYLILQQDKNLQEDDSITPTQTDVQVVPVVDDTTFNPESDFIETVVNLDGSVADVVGTNLITTDNKVVNDLGQVVQSNALPMTPEAPKLSAPLTQADLSDTSIKLQANASGFTPNEFTVKANSPVTLVLTSVGVGSRLVFNDPTLIALELPVPSGYTMAKTFNSPGTPGEYTFYQDMPNRSNQTGKMIVK